MSKSVKLCFCRSGMRSIRTCLARCPTPLPGGEPPGHPRCFGVPRGKARRVRPTSSQFKRIRLDELFHGIWCWRARRLPYHPPDAPLGNLDHQSFGKGFDTGPPQTGAGSFSFCEFSRLLLVFLGLPAGCPTFPALFEGLCFCGGVSVDRNLLVSL